MDDLIRLTPLFWEAIGETLQLVWLSLLFGGLGGLLFGGLLYATRPGSLFPNGFVYGLVNVIVNIFRPIPFLIFLPAVQPLARALGIVAIGTGFAIFAISLAASFAIARLVEQNLLTVNPGVIEASRAAGASRLRTMFQIVIPEALGPLILGFTFAFVALVDMSAVAGYIGGGGLGNFAIQYGMRQFNPTVTWAAVIIIIILVQLIQF
ncbi:MAG: methionine ABC transporter permease, partial [Mycetocola sp.]